MTLEERIIALIFPTLHPMGYDVVRVKMQGGAKRSTLQIMIERLDEKEITVDDCEKVSRQVSALMDVEDPIQTEYYLEVSSPGLDRPLTRLKDFERYIGHEAKITLEAPQDNRKRFRSVIAGVKEGVITVTLPDDHDAEITIDFNIIASAKLVLTDKLLGKETTKRPGKKKE